MMGIISEGQQLAPSIKQSNYKQWRYL